MKVAGTNEDWILLDENVDGIYVVNYDVTNWRLLIRQLETDREALTLNSRFRLLIDACYLSEKELLSPAICFDMLSSVRFENDTALWRKAYEILKEYDDKLDRRPASYHLRAMMRDMIEERLKTITRYELSVDEMAIAKLGGHECSYEVSSWMEDVENYFENHYTNKR